MKQENGQERPRGEAQKGAPPEWAALAPKDQSTSPIGQGSVLQSAAPPPVCWLAAAPCSPERKCRAWPREGRGQGSHKGLHLAYSLRGGAGPSFSRMHAAQTLLTGLPYSKRKTGENQNRRSLAREPGISQGEKRGSQSPGMGLWGTKGSCSPLGHSEQEPNAWGSPCPSGGRRATTALPSVLCSGDDPVLSTPERFLRNLREGGAPGNLPEASSTCAHWPPPKTDTSVTPGGWCRTQMAPSLHRLGVIFQNQGLPT